MTPLPLEWSYNPWRDRPGRAAVALVASLLCCALAVTLRLPTVPTLLLCVVSVATLAAGFLPVRCRVDEAGVIRRSGWLAERRAWDQLRRAVRRPDGVWLSPYRSRHWLDPYRALYLPFPDGASAPSCETLDRILASHGL
jgi:hypothetical protein